MSTPETLRGISSMEIRIEIRGEVTGDEIIALRRAVGWETDSKYPRMLEKSFFYVVARGNGRLVGFLNVVGSEVGDILIHDVCVHPDCQRKGVGTRMLQAALDYCKGFPIQGINILFEPHNKAFFERFGFRMMLGGYLDPKKHWR